MREEIDIQNLPFNMSLLYYTELNKLIAKKDEAHIVGNMYGYYATLRTIYYKIIFVIKKETKRKELLKKFDEAQKLLELPPIQNKKLQLQLQQMQSKKLLRILEELDTELTEIMDSATMIFPKIETKSFQKIYEEYGIKN